MRKLASRVARVAGAYRDRPCAVCVAWSPDVIVGVDERWADGDPLALPYPEHCPGCGRRTIDGLMVLVGVDAEAI